MSDQRPEGITALIVMSTWSSRIEAVRLPPTFLRQLRIAWLTRKRFDVQAGSEPVPGRLAEGAINSAHTSKPGRSGKATRDESHRRFLKASLQQVEYFIRMFLNFNNGVVFTPDVLAHLTKLPDWLLL